MTLKSIEERWAKAWKTGEFPIRLIGNAKVGHGVIFSPEDRDRVEKAPEDIWRLVGWVKRFTQVARHSVSCAAEPWPSAHKPMRKFYSCGLSELLAEIEGDEA